MHDLNENVKLTFKVFSVTELTNVRSSWIREEMAGDEVEAVDVVDVFVSFTASGVNRANNSRKSETIICIDFMSFANF